MASPAFPIIPGQTFGNEMRKKTFLKPQLLRPDGVKDGPGPDNSSSGQKVQKLAGTLAASQKALGNSGSYGPAAAALGAQGALGGAAVGSLEKVVLRFFAYFTEAVHDSAAENRRHRKCTILFHLEDDTISIAEPKIDNSGIAQGQLIKRHQIPSEDGNFFQPVDFKVGTDIVIYGKIFHIVDADPFTRSFFANLGVEVPEAEPYPGDQYFGHRGATQDAARLIRNPGDRELSRQLEMSAVGRSTRLTPADVEKGKRFFQADRKVLRFFAVWDDRHNMYGDFRMFVIYFFLADSTIQICEVNPPNSGRDPFPSFAGRRRVERGVQPDVSLAFSGSKGTDYYEAEDLKVGETVVMYGNPFFLYDCDPFTRTFMADNFGFDTPAIDISQITAQANQRSVPQPPPHTGFGDEADALGSWLSLVPKPPRKNLAKFHAAGNSMLKFELKFANPTKADAIRRFVLTCHLSDDTISIFETIKHNSGMVGGKFLQKQKVKKPDGTFFTPRDFYIGAAIVINKHQFIVTGSDERSINHMEASARDFPQADPVRVIQKMRAMISSPAEIEELFTAADVDGSGVLDFREFASVIGRVNFAEGELSEHEVMTIMRHFDKNGDGKISWTEFFRYLSDADGQAAPEQAPSPAASSPAAGSPPGRTYADQVAEAAAQKLLARYSQRRQLFRDTIRKLAENSPDGHIGEAELRKCCDKLGIQITEMDFKALAIKIFPPERRRIPLIEFGRMLEGCSSVLNIDNINSPVTASKIPLTQNEHGGVR